MLHQIYDFISNINENLDRFNNHLDNLCDDLLEDIEDLRNN